MNISAGSDTIQLTNVEIINGGTLCRVRVWVHLTADEPGTYQHNVSMPTSPILRGKLFPVRFQDTITVSDFWIEKSFSHNPITRGGKTIVTVTIAQ